MFAVRRTAASLRQCGSKKVSGQNLPKMGILRVTAGDFRQILVLVALFWRLETARRTQEACVGNCSGNASSTEVSCNEIGLRGTKNVKFPVSREVALEIGSNPTPRSVRTTARLPGWRRSHHNPAGPLPVSMPTNGCFAPIVLKNSAVEVEGDR